ncbi:hypothetical protein [Sutcliffiella halmapala]|nr:hypothetical protein [Sutcliffiella halmapala]
MIQTWRVMGEKKLVAESVLEKRKSEEEENRNVRSRIIVITS